MTSLLPPPRTLRVLTPAEWSNDQRGDFFEQIAGELLRRQRWQVSQRVRFTGMEVDLLADNLDTGERAFVQCKFVQDPLSANVIDLLMGQATRRRATHAFVLSTSEAGREARGALDEIRSNNHPGLPRIAFWGPDKLLEIITQLHNLVSPPAPLERRATSISLFVTPISDPFWALEESREGQPWRVMLFHAFPNAIEPLPHGPICALFTSHGLYNGLDVFLATSGVASTGASSDTTPDTQIAVSRTPVADSIDDYRPCRPEDFVGRTQIQQEMRQFFERVRNGDTETRLIALSGPSGYGKSSVVLKLADQFRNRRWKNQFYLFPVDTRSARHAYFVQAAIVEAIRSAMADGFLGPIDASLSISSVAPVLEIPGVREAVERLSNESKVLVVFFDQFEEILTKPELRSLFEVFRQVAFEIHSEKTNLILGFSWRTGVTLSDDNPAYHTWHSLSDLRKHVSLDSFDPGESSELITQFEKALKQKLLTPLRRRLEEQAQGIPWLLKKLAIHVYHEISKGEDQLKLLSQRLNVRSLFDSDLVSLSSEAMGCLRYIASNSPADIADVAEKFSVAVVDRLYTARLIVKTGYRYAVYWDIFRDYLRDGTVPVISWTYAPQVPLSMLIHVFSQLRESGSLTLSELAERTGYNERTALNVMSDLQNFLLAHRRSDGAYEVLPELQSADLEGIAEHVAENLKEHVLIQEIYRRLDPGESMPLSQVDQIIRDRYGDVSRSDRTLDGYTQRFSAWFQFAGIATVSQHTLTRPVGRGVGFGIVRMGRRDHAIGFMASSSVDHVIDDAVRLSAGPLAKADIQRNSGYDLVALDLAFFGRDETIIPHKSLTLVSTREQARALVLTRADKSPFMRAYRAISTQPNLTIADEGRLLGEALGRDWSEASAYRYVMAARRWRTAIDTGSLDPSPAPGVPAASPGT